jgi:hypothetical protein
MRPLLLLALCACSSSGSDDVRGPFTGEVRRFVVDRISVPATSDETNAFAGDLDGNGVAENKLGLATATLGTTNDLSRDAQDMIASGALSSVVEVQADDLANDDSVGVRYLGADDSPALVAGGTLVDGAFRSNRAATTRVPGRAVIHLPIFTNADPLQLPLEGLEIDLTSDGAGGFDAIIRGGIRQTDARAISYTGLTQMFETEPERHLVFQRQVDTNRDGLMSDAELEESVIALLVTADIQLFDGTKYAPKPMPTQKDSLSIAFGVHLAPCPAGRCSTALPTNTCRDRIRDAAETDVDCGGPTCQRCWDGLACTVPTDCQSNACVANKCAPSSCTNSVRDGYESDVDCGSTCAACATGAVCAADSDCTSSNCNNGPAVTGRCL